MDVATSREDHVPVRSAEGSIVGETGRRAARGEGLQRPGHVVAVERRHARSSWAVGDRRAGRRRPWDVVARRCRARTARGRWNHGDGSWWHVVTIAHVATVVHGIPAARRVSACANTYTYLFCILVNLEFSTIIKFKMDTRKINISNMLKETSPIIYPFLSTFIRKDAPCRYFIIITERF